MPRDPIAELVHLYADAVVHHNGDQWGACWAPDAHWELGKGRRVEGRDAILELWHGAMGTFAAVVQTVLNGTYELDDDADLAAGSSAEDERQELLRRVEPEDLQRFGLIPELVGRLPVSVALTELDEEALCRILVEPNNALVKQYSKMFELEGIGLTFDKDAIRAIAKKTMEQGTGARGLRSVIEDLMRDVMFEIPSRNDVREVVVTPESVEHGVAPLLVLHPEEEKLKA